MTFAITAPYAAALTLILVVLTQLVIRARLKTAVVLGDGGDVALLEASRRQMNFVENVPMTLIVMAFAEAGGASAMVLNIAGLALVAARLIHPFGISAAKAAHPLRIVGSVATTAVQLGMVVILTMQYFA